MKPFDRRDGHDQHDHAEDKSIIDRIKRKVKGYWNNMNCSNKCKKMSRGSYCIMRSMPWGHGEEWRKNHPKSLNKKH